MAPTDNMPFSWSTFILPGAPSDITPNHDFILEDPPTPSRNRKGEAKARRKNDPDYVPRPPNSFLVFRSAFFKEHQERNLSSNPPSSPSEPEHTSHVATSLDETRKGRKELQINISRLAGQKWRVLSDSEKKAYTAEAETKRVEHKVKYPDYRYAPSPKKRREKVPKTTVKCLKKKTIPKKHARAPRTRGVEFLLGQAHYVAPNTNNCSTAPTKFLSGQPSVASSSSSSNPTSIDSPIAPSHLLDSDPFVAVQGQSNEDALIHGFHRLNFDHDHSPDHALAYDVANMTPPPSATHTDNQSPHAFVGPAAHPFSQCTPVWAQGGFPLADPTQMGDVNPALFTASDHVLLTDTQISFPVHTQTTTYPALVPEPSTFGLVDARYPIELSHFNPHLTQYVHHAQPEPLKGQTQGVDVVYYDYDTAMAPQTTFQFEDALQYNQSWAMLNNVALDVWAWNINAMGGDGCML